MTIVLAREKDEHSGSDGIASTQQTTMTKWRDHLERYNKIDGVDLFDKKFLERWGDQPWKDDDSKADDVEAAAKLHIQLVSRITTQRLPYADGVEVTALDSVYRLFGEARDIFKAHPKSRLTEAVSWEVLNEHVRPFTAKWHRQSQRGALDALDETDIFRDELSSLQRKLIVFDALLLEIRDDKELPFAQDGGESVRERSIGDEMDPGKPENDLPWGIHPRFGGLRDEKVVDAINAKEQGAIGKRREYYQKRIDEEAARKAKDAAAQKAITAARDGEGAPVAPVPPHAKGEPAQPRGPSAWTDRQHTVALAISGGGIRSATFALGVLVALARRNLLYQFDYLSTVSGGGYIGSFLTTFLNAEEAAQQQPSQRQAASETAGRQAAKDIGLRRGDLPFRREDGEAAALRHVRTTANIWRPAGCGNGCR